MSAGAEADQLIPISQVGATLVILVFKPIRIYQQLFWSRLAREWRNWHVLQSSFSPVGTKKLGTLLHSRCRLHIHQSFGRSRIFRSQPHLRSLCETNPPSRRRGRVAAGLLPDTTLDPPDACSNRRLSEAYPAAEQRCQAHRG